MEAVLGSGAPPALAGLRPPTPAPDPPRWDGAASQTAQEKSRQLHNTRQSLYSAHQSAQTLVEQAGQTITGARTEMRGVHADWERDKAAIAPFAGRPEGLAALAAAGQLRLAEANHIITTTTEHLNTVATNLHQLTSQLPLTPPESGGPPVPQDNGEGHPTDPHATLRSIEEPNRELLEELKKEYQQLPEGQIKTDRLADIAGIEKSLEVRDSHLIYIARPDDPSQMVPAAVSVGDPYAADHVSVTVPGVGSTTRKSLSTMTEEAAELKREADGISDAVVKVGQTRETVAAIAYLGYQPPLTMTSPEMLNDGLAQAGAPKLTAFLGDLNAAAKPGHTTALYGHSYGSLMSGIALKEGAGSMVDNVVLYGSPGFAATSPAQLGLRNDQFFVMSTPDDFIANTIGGAAPLHGWGADPNTVVGGQYLFTHLETQAGTVSLGTDSMGRAIEWDKIAAHGHSEYGRNATERMTGFNLAAILLDRPDLTVKAVPPALSDTRWGR